MDSPKRKAFIVEHGIGFTEIAKALGKDRSAISHTFAGNRNNPALQQEIVKYLRRRLKAKRAPSQELQRIDDLFVARGVTAT
jgi:hypothetical protein